MTLNLPVEEASLTTAKYNQILTCIYEREVRSSPPIRFVPNEVILSKALYGNYLHYFGYVTTLDTKVLASDLHLQGFVDVHFQKFTFLITVPDDTKKEEIRTKLKSHLVYKDKKTSMFPSPVWVGDHLEIEFSNTKNAAFILGVYLFEKHISGSPADFSPENGLQMSGQDNNEMDSPQPTSIRRVGMYGFPEGSLHIPDEGNTTTGKPLGKSCQEQWRTYKIPKKFQINIKEDAQSTTKNAGKVHTDESQNSDKVLNSSLHASTCLKREKICPVQEEPVMSQQNFRGSTSEMLMIQSSLFNHVRGSLVFTTSFESPYTLNRPIGILQLSSENIIVSDTFNDRLLKLNKEGVALGHIGSTLGLRRPSALAELRDGSFAVTCSRFIVLFDAEGYNGKVLGKNILQRPYGLCVTEDEKLLTVETYYPGILILITICPKMGNEVTRIRVPLYLEQQQVKLSKPRFVAVHKNKMYIGDLGLDCVYEMNYKTGSLLDSFGCPGATQGCLNDPSGIACDNDGNIYVADSRNHRIQIFDSAKRLICIIELDHSLNRPSGIYLGRDDSMFVLNYWNNSVDKYYLTFSFV